METNDGLVEKKQGIISIQRCVKTVLPGSKILPENVLLPIKKIYHCKTYLISHSNPQTWQEFFTRLCILAMASIVILRTLRQGNLVAGSIRRLIWDTSTLTWPRVRDWDWSREGIERQGGRQAPLSLSIAFFPFSLFSTNSNRLFASLRVPKILTLHPCDLWFQF